MKLSSLLALLGLLAVTVTARAETLTTSGTCKKGSNWSTGVKPTFETPVDIPAGKTLLVKEAACKTGDLSIEGTVSGSSALEVAGSVSGPLETTSLTTFGMGTLNIPGKAPAILIEGTEELAAPLEAKSVNINGGFYTNGYNVTAEGEIYTHIKFPLAHLWINGSTLTAPVFESYEPDQTEQFSETATVNVCATHRFTGGFIKEGEGGVFYGQEQAYGTVILGCVEPYSATNWTTGVLALNSTDGPVIFQPASEIHATTITTTGTEAHPVRVQSTGSEIVCGCSAPAGLELVGVTVE